MALREGSGVAIIREIYNRGSTTVADGSRKWRFDIRFEIPQGQGESEFAIQPFWCPDKRHHTENLFKHTIGVELASTLRYDSKEFFHLLQRLVNTSLRVKAVLKTKKGFGDFFIMPVGPVTGSEVWGAAYDERYWPDESIIEPFENQVLSKKEPDDEYDIYGAWDQSTVRPKARPSVS